MVKILRLLLFVPHHPSSSSTTMSAPELSVSIPQSGKCTPPELSPSSSPTSSSQTNTLVIASLPPSFFEPLVLNALRDHFESFGHLHSWAPLRSFARIILVYYSEHDAEIAKQSCDCLVVGPVGDMYVSYHTFT